MLVGWSILRGMFNRLGSLITKRKVAILLLAVALITTATWYGMGLFGNLSSSGYADKNAESTKALQLLDEKFPSSGGNLIVIFTAKDGAPITSPSNAAEVRELLNQYPKDQVTSWQSTGAESFISKDKKSTFATIVASSKEASKVEQAREQLTSGKLDVLVGGTAALNLDINNQIEHDLLFAETVSFAVLGVLLVIVFRSVVAALLPLALGGVAILGAFALTRLLTNFTDISNYAINVITLLGLGLAIDYALFIVSRFREEMAKNNKQALATTVATAGRTVFFSGLTVIVCLLSLQVFPLNFLRSISLGGASAVLVAMLSALVFLPALVGLLGRRVNWLPVGRKVQASNQASFWASSGRFFMRWPWASIFVSLGVLLALGMPFLNVNFGSPDYKSLPAGSQSREVTEKLLNDFGNQPDQIIIAYVANGPITTRQGVADLYDYGVALQSLSGVEKVESITTLDEKLNKSVYQQLLTSDMAPLPIKLALSSNVNSNVAKISVAYYGAAEGDLAQQLVTDIRNLPKPAGVTTYVGGGPAELRDLLDVLGRYIPVGLVVIALAVYILLFLMLGSLILPIKAIIMNVLSLTTAFGAMVLIFQDGFMANWFNLIQVDALDATMPILIFAIAFGLSTDYSVFLYSRIKEQYDITGDSDEAVVAGLRKTGLIITSAAILLFVVVAAFASARIPLLQQVGVGLALTVLIDAFLVRMVVVPSLMKPLGRWNWWAPEPLKKLYSRLGLGE